MQDLVGRVAVVTGAGNGIGRALAQRLAAEGMRVALADVDTAALGDTGRLLVEAGVDPGDVLAQPTDVRLEDDVTALADRVFREWGQVDLLCNNAGVFVGGFLWERPAADLEFVLGVNVWGILHGIRAFVPRMIAQGTPGHVVDTCSVAGLLGSPYSGPYGISKFAALAATEALALDLEAVGSQIKVTALCPGMVRTSIADDVDKHRPTALRTEATDDQAFVNEMLGVVTQQGIDPAEVAQMVVAAVREERFLLLTHAHHAQPLRDRAESLATGQLPPRGDFT
ncbi:SDR family NAD(P)-dependent oxidoreductase [Iamia sp. SCSIO 61187]|uniref:SDR family NAD(P)-dependent oxidoreductase n=1 Tax=Iamia sp. SCSIO 61187 TaxID=2722752 RepID=UPI001C63463C|nr:SDR family NAD(P)-dependent oxidoreductase [Iamia sp. SCSIO 61187]QYG95064.1 SDR family NAD(P)-dependent oxidoreductase [Iamia sp. SCSIO 61187]